MRLNKLFGAGVKLGGAAACGFCAGALALISGRDPGGTNDATILALVAGLGGSSLILAGQAIGDVVAAFKADRESE